VKPRVLLVDDFPANLVALTAALDGLPCDLVTARSGNEALRHLLRDTFAVLLLDVRMPDMDGFEVARWARDRESSRDVPIIFLTAMDETEGDVLRGYASGAVDFLFKPFNVHVLRSKVQVFLDLEAGRQRLAQEIAAHEATMRELEAFSYSVSHDLRAPLRSIGGFTRIVLEDHGPQLPDEAKKHLERVVAAADRMNVLISDLLELARVARTDLERTTVNISALARDTLERLRATDPTRKVEIVIERDLEVSADQRLCSVVLENLLANAWKFTAKRADALIEVGRHASDTNMLFVRDNGAGFDMEHAKKLFGTFVRLHSSKEFEGTGVGLATVRRIVERHGGSIRADAQPGAGATFSFGFEPASRLLGS
jgi:two-component system, sensor histidine kinase and response regulator